MAKWRREEDRRGYVDGGDRQKWRWWWRVVPAARVGEESSGGRGDGFGVGSKEDLDTGNEGDDGRGAMIEFMQTSSL